MSSSCDAGPSEDAPEPPRIVSLGEYEKMHGEIGADGKNTRRAAKKVDAAREQRYQERLQHRRERKGEKILSRSEVALHNRPNDIYVILEGVVFDATSFLSDHPGGKEILLEHAGQDITTPFTDLGHSQLAKFQLADLYVGDLPMIERVNLDESSDDDDEEAAQSGSESEYDEDGIKILKPNKKQTTESTAVQGKSEGAEDTKGSEEERAAPQVDRIVANRYRRTGPAPPAPDAATSPATRRDNDDDKYGKKRPQLAAPGLSSTNWRMLTSWPLAKAAMRKLLLLLWSLRAKVLSALLFALVLGILANVRIPWWLLGHDAPQLTDSTKRLPLEGDVYASDPNPVSDPSLLHSVPDIATDGGGEDQWDGSEVEWRQPPREHDPSAVLWF